MLRFVVGVFFVLHGLVHLLPFGVSWQLFTTDDLPYSTVVLGGRVDVGHTGIRLVGLLWLLATLIWVVAGVGLILLAPWWTALTVAAALFSSLVCILGLPMAKYGLLINVVVLVLVVLNGQFHWLPPA